LQAAPTRGILAVMRNGFAIVIAALGLAGAAQAQTASQFDLVCTGSVKHLDGSSEPWNERVVVDLERRIYCEPGCAHSFPIKRVEDGSLVFEQSRKSDEFGASEFEFSVSRSDGAVTKHVFTHGVAHLADVVAGSCAKAPFSGFPKNLF
jgi:hypothetical protein